MNPKEILDTAKKLLKAAKENPKDFGDLAKANPDEKEDAKLGEKVEEVVEEHMSDNKEAETKEGHKMAAKNEIMGYGAGAGAMAMKEMIKEELKSDFKPRFKKCGSSMMKDEKKPRQDSPQNLAGIATRVHAAAPKNNRFSNTVLDYALNARHKSYRKLKQQKAPNLPKSDIKASVMEKWEPKFYKSAQKDPSAKPVFSPKMIKPSDVKDHGAAGMAIPNPAPKKKMN